MNYLQDQLITYIGNKRKLLSFIDEAITYIKKDSKLEKFSILDGFSGSGIVSRKLKEYSSILYSNDLEYYSYIINKCYLSNIEDIPIDKINYHINKLNSIKYSDYTGIISKLYSPKDDKDIKLGERCFYTNKNARILDNSINYIHNNIEEEIRHYFIAPLLSEASIHVNTSGIFKGFYKNSETGKGQFGGNGKNALKRILGEIEIKSPIFSEYSCEHYEYNSNINDLIKDLPEVNIAYYDPPYNSHPYGSNYFMLNIIASGKEPKELSTVSGIPDAWNRSDYNYKDEAEIFLNDLINNTKSKYIILSYNNEGIIPFDNIKTILSNYGKLTILEKEYNTFRGSRNLSNRNKKTIEYLFVLQK